MGLQIVSKTNLIVRSAQHWLARSRYNLLLWLLNLQLRTSSILNTSMLDQYLRNQDLDPFICKELPQQLLFVLAFQLSNGNFMIQFRVSKMSLIDFSAAYVL